MTWLQTHACIECGQWPCKCNTELKSIEDKAVERIIKDYTAAPPHSSDGLREAKQEPPDSVTGDWIEEFEQWLIKEIESADNDYANNPTGTMSVRPSAYRHVFIKFQKYKQLNW